MGPSLGFPKTENKENSIPPPITRPLPKTFLIQWFQEASLLHYICEFHMLQEEDLIKPSYQVSYYYHALVMHYYLMLRTKTTISK